MRKTIFSLLILCLALPVAGESTRVWRQSNFSDFSKGTHEGVALRSDGEISLAPALEKFADPELEFIWAVAEDRKGTVYLGGGSPAKVLSVAKDGTVATIFESEELEVHALAVDERSGAVYAATSPDGKVYRISKNGESEELFDPESKYIWALARDKAGNLYAATGDKGTIFRIAPDGAGEVFFQSGETHIRSLAIGPGNQLYAGTEPSGLIYRITPGGEAFVLYETANKEVTSLSVDAGGSLYASSIGSKRPQPGTPGVPLTGIATSSAASTAAAAVAAAQLTTGAAVSTRRIPFLTAGGSGIYKIAPDGFPSLLWNSRSQLVYSLAFDGNDRLLAGTGNKGKLFAIDSAILYSDIARVAGQQITVVHRARDGSVLLATANPGMLYRLGPEPMTEGVIESDVFDADLYTQWGRINWRGRGANNGGDGVTLYTRSGNTSDPSAHWSPWSEAYTDSAGTTITSPPARFIQWKAVLTGQQPSLSSVEVAYLRRNLAPTIEAIVVQRPGIRVRETPKGSQSFTPAKLELPPPARSARGARGVTISAPARSMQRPQAPPQGSADATARAVLWTAADPNGDDLAFTVYYRGEDEKEWKLMAENLSDRYYSWERTTLPDGVYLLKIVGSDAPSNPADLALRSENVSDRFEVDNTAPTITGLQTASSSATVVRFAASDSFSKLGKAEYSLDAADWKLVFPTTRTTDARDHSYEIDIGTLPKGEHSLVVRVQDSFGNIALARTTFVVH